MFLYAKLTLSLLLLFCKFFPIFIHAILVMHSSSDQCYSSSENHFSFSFYKVFFKNHFSSVSVSVFTSFQLQFFSKATDNLTINY